MNLIGASSLVFVPNEVQILFCTFLWALNALINTPLAKREGAVRLVFFQGLVTLAGLLLVSPFILGAEDLRALDWSIALPFLLVVSPLMGGGAALLYLALNEIGVARAQSVSNSYPALTTIASIFVLRESPTIYVISGCLAVIAGIGLISQSQVMGETQSISKMVLLRTRGFWYAVASAFCFAIGTIIMKMLLSSGINPFMGNILRAPGIILFAFFILAREKKRLPIWSLSLKSLLAIIVASLFCHMVADILYLRVLQSSDASIIVPIASATPLWVAPLAFIFLKEKMNWRTILGMILTVVGIVAILS